MAPTFVSINQKICFQKKPEPVKPKMLELLQVWSHAFRNEVSYKVVQDTFNLLKVEGEFLLYITSCYSILSKLGDIQTHLPPSGQS